MKNLRRLQEIEKLDTDVKDKTYFVINNIIQNEKTKKHWLPKTVITPQCGKCRRLSHKDI